MPSKIANRVSDILKQPKKAFSFEFFPPKTEKGARQLLDSISSLIELHPSYVSVTYGAGGSTRQLTHDLVMRIQSQTDLTVVSHLTCVGASQDEIREILETYHESGIRNIMALRGDPPQGTGRFERTEGGFGYANELVDFIRRHFPDMSVGVAGFTEGHPETPNRMSEIEFLKAKVDAGADYIITQLFFDNRDFYDFCERCEMAGINVPIIAGIMPIISKRNMEMMAEKACGVRYPARLLKALSRADDDDAFAKIGTHWATEQVFDLLANDVKGVHFYTLNRSQATRQVYNSLGVTSSRQLQD
jgi:methylenetetrahydrofolate reductase (NADPH)